MKHIIYILLILGLVSGWQATADEAELIKKLRHAVDPRVSRGDVSEETATNKWGGITGNVQLSISLKGGHGQISTNEPVVLMLRFKNVSINETFTIDHSNNERAQDGFDFLVIPPSGKETRLIAGLLHGSGSFMNIGPNQIGHFAFTLSRLFTFNEIGTYRVVASRTMLPPATQKQFTVVSNPLLFSVAPD